MSGAYDPLAAVAAQASSPAPAQSAYDPLAAVASGKQLPAANESSAASSSSSAPTWEQDWATHGNPVNQFVQGSASLIFKQALIDIARHIGIENILLPMHDAVLLQYDANQITKEDCENQTRNLMAAAFRKWFPEITPKVVSGSFGAPEFITNR